MARRLSRREYGLLALLAIVAIGLLYLNQGGRLTGQRRTTDAAEQLDWGEAPQVHMDLLAQHVAAYDPNGRNLFKYYTPPPPPQPVASARPAPPRPKPPPYQPPPKRDPTPAPVRQRQPPPINLTYLGFLGPKTDKIAVFEDSNAQELILARAGETIRNQFRVVDFGYQSITMGYTDKEFENATKELPQSAGSRR